MEQQPEHIAKERILKAKSTQATKLDLDGLGLVSLPGELFELRGLKRLHIKDNNLKTLSPDIGRLTSLHELDVSGNHLSSMPRSLAQLKHLRTLNLSRNQLANLPKPIRFLSHLESLNLERNQLGALPGTIDSLGRLKELNLSHNKIHRLPTNIGQLEHLRSFSVANNNLSFVPDGIGSLGMLEYLNLSNNQITDLSGHIGNLKFLRSLQLSNNYINHLPQSVSQLKRLNSNSDLEEPGLLLDGNRFAIPEEVLKRDPQSILQYINDLQASRKNKPLHEAKVIFIGSGYVGKTSLINMLLEGEFNQTEGKTDGIEIRKWAIRRGKDDIRLNIWDFGGQEIMHATHKFFMTSRSAYVLVINPRAEDKYGDSELEYWLKLIRSYAGEVPVIVVVNKCEVHKIDIPQSDIREKYPNIVGFVETSCKTEVGIGELKRLIRRSVSQLSHIDDLLPQSYFDIKELLEKRNDDFIPYADYQHLCKEVEDKFQEQSMRSLMHLLHDLGVMLNFGDDDRRLAHTQVLNPEWVTTGVYKIISSPRLIKKRGILTHREISRILDGEKYPTEKERFYIMDMMDRFELCYQVPDVRDTFFVPGAFPKDRPKSFEWKFQAKEKLRFQYHYDVMPSSIMSRFIVKVHDFIRGRGDYWRNGVIIRKGNCDAYIKADPEERKIFVEVIGKGRKRDLLSFIRDQFELIHNRLSNIKVETKIPINESGAEVLDYENLLFYEEMEEEFILVKSIREKLRVKELLNGVDTEQDREAYRKKETRVESLEDYNTELQTVDPARPFFPFNLDGTNAHWYHWVFFIVTIVASIAAFFGAMAEIAGYLNW